MRRYNLLTLLSFVTVLAILFAMYPAAWKLTKLGTATVTTLLVSLLGIVSHIGRTRDSVLGAAIVGGVIGANAASLLHFLLSYTVLDSYDSRGMQLLDVVLMFAPVASLAGAAGGAFLFVGLNRMPRLNICAERGLNRNV